MAWASGRLLLQARIFIYRRPASAPSARPDGFTHWQCSHAPPGWQSPGSRLASRGRRTAHDELHDTVLRRHGDHVGNIAPCTIEQTGRDIVFLSDRADLAAVLAAYPPDDLDVLLAGLGVCGDDLGIEHQVRLRLRIADDRDILPLQDLGDRPGQRLRTVSRGTRHAA